GCVQDVHNPRVSIAQEHHCRLDTLAAPGRIGDAVVRIRSVHPWMVLAVVTCSLCVQAHLPPPPPPPDWTEDDVDIDATVDGGNDAQAVLFDRLRGDSSPRQQVLAGRLSFGEDDGTPTALRPKREEVVARAVRLAPDDVWVQWEGAVLGDYRSSLCGP